VKTILLILIIAVVAAAQSKAPSGDAAHGKEL
jgi:hypothetical protein